MSGNEKERGLKVKNKTKIKSFYMFANKIITPYTDNIDYLVSKNPRRPTRFYNKNISSVS